jgi:hypothetical protein
MLEQQMICFCFVRSNEDTLLKISLPLPVQWNDAQRPHQPETETPLLEENVL